MKLLFFMYACHKILNVARTNIRIFFKGDMCHEKINKSNFINNNGKRYL